MKTILHAGEGEHLFVLSDLVTIKISARDTANQYAVFHETVPPAAPAYGLEFILPPPQQVSQIASRQAFRGASGTG